MKKDKSSIRRELISKLEEQKKGFNEVHEMLFALEDDSSKRIVRSHWGALSVKANGISQSIRVLIANIDEMFDNIEIWRKESERLDDIANKQ